ncbi:MAG TPA: helix-turn-helix domain-containing protein [Patescibacteria group bacterium]|nr:helix-turn-helix domain-containing protein [Patescibacteria group bacterium]
MEELIRELVHLGLSEKEAAVYLASLELGPAVVQDIAKKADVNRATTYVMIESLAARGLMSTFVRGKKRFFAAEPPDRLLTIIRLQRRELEEKEQEISGVLPQLHALFKTDGSKPHVRYLEGPEGIASVRETFEAMEGEFLEIVSIDDADQVDAILHQRETHIRQLEKDGATYRLLAVMKEPDFVRIVPPLPGGEVRLIPVEKFPLHGDLVIRGNTVFLYSFTSSMLGVVLTSKEIADTVRGLFNLAWEGSTSYPSEKR